MKAQAMKQTLRQSIIAARLKLAASEHIEFSRTISKYIMLLDVYKRAKVVLGYMSFGAEFSTTPWIQQAMQDGKQVLLPKVNTSSKQLDIYQVKDLQQDLQADAWDIPEPLPERCAKVEALADIDFILLPGVAFARDGWSELLVQMEVVLGNRHWWPQLFRCNWLGKFRRSPPIAK
jgi:5-formyltetrahydrofolate cyclo-ligase